jgi:hypothetical protein
MAWSVSPQRIFDCNIHQFKKLGNTKFQEGTVKKRPRRPTSIQSKVTLRVDDYGKQA